MSVTAVNETMTEATSCVSPEVFREGMTSLAGAVNIVTTNGPGGRGGFTATAVCSVSDNPATLLVCLNRGASVHQVFKQNTKVVINTLAPEHESLSNIFGGKSPMEERFAVGNWLMAEGEAPVLADAAVSFACTITEMKSVATHDVIFCQVNNITQRKDAGALLYLHRGYRTIAMTE